MKFERVFTKGCETPYDGINFVERSSSIKNEDGSKASASLTVIVPDFWSQIATDILAQKYLRKAGVPVPGGAETDCRQVFHRMAGCWRHWGEKHGYFDHEEDALAFYDELCFMLAHQIAAPNSPQWFNTGLHYAYGLEGKGQGHWFVDQKTNELTKAASAYERPQGFACFIQSIEDDLVSPGGIMDLWTREARLFKYGSGSGTNYSNIRGEGEPLSGGGMSSGLMSFLKIGDAAAGAIKSGGTTRRAARLVLLDVDHPDIEKFVEWKVLEEQKVAALVTGSKIIARDLKAIFLAAKEESDVRLRNAVAKAQQDEVPMNYVQRVLDLVNQGIIDIQFEVYNTDWNSKAYGTVSGQNSNNSVRLSNAFLTAVREGSQWSLIGRTTKQVTKTISAKDLWHKIAYAAWNSADPGVMFSSTINEWHTCPKGGEIRAANPCGEFHWIDNSACNLASINLVPFLNGVFDTVGFSHAVRLWTVALDITTQMGQFPSKEIARNGWDYRTIGLGYCNLGALLMRMGLPYGGKAALAVTGGITSLLCGTAYETSAELASSLGEFPKYLENAEAMQRVVRNHRRAATQEGSEGYEGLTKTPLGISQQLCPLALYEASKAAWTNAEALGKVYGYRNAQVTVIAPTGTIGLLMDADTTGIEPDFALVKYKKLAGGGYFKIINQSVPPALYRLGYNDQQIEDIRVYCIGHGTLEGAPIINPQSLKAKGFTDDMLYAIEQGLGGAFDISFVLNKWLVGEEFCRNALNIEKSDLDDPDFNLLSAIGFSVDEIDMANEYVCGSMTIEGAPYIKPEHLAVFDCANKCGRKGERFIHYEKHLDMLAAAQPFVSGSISKTVNLPYNATVDDIKRVYSLAWDKMLKCVALYRDGSKLSQPLNTTAMSDLLVKVIEEAPVVDQIKTLVETIRKREPLPSRRTGYTQKMQIGGHNIYLRTGDYEDGRLGEIFLDLSKEGTLMRSMLNSFAIAVSLGLQYGVPLEEFVDVFTFSRFEPNGMVQGHKLIKMATSIIDLIFRDLALNYLDRSDLAHVVEETEAKKAPARITKSMEAKLKGYEGDPCPDCGAMTLVRNGSCLKCDSCGATTGCS